MLPRIAYVTQAGASDPDPDLPLATDALRRVGLDTVPVPWEAEVDWGDFDLVLVRSAGGLADRRQDFLRWARAVERETMLVNPALTLARNTDQTYLRDLARQGLPTIETIWFEPGDSADACRAQVRQRGWRRCVVQSNTGWGSALTGTPDQAVAVAADLASRGGVGMIQPDLGASPRTSVVVLGGRITHAVARGSRRAGGGALTTVPLDEDLVELSRRIMDVAAAGENLLYARVDLVQRQDRWVLSGFRATEPCLFLHVEPRAADHLARAVRQWITPDVRESGSPAG